MTEMRRTDASWMRAARQWLKAHESAEKAKLNLEKKRWALLRLAGEASASGAGVTVARFFRAGTINYGSIPELQGVPLDSYRATGSWQFRVTKE